MRPMAAPEQSLRTLAACAVWMLRVCCACWADMPLRHMARQPPSLRSKCNACSLVYLAAACIQDVADVAEARHFNGADNAS